MNSGCYTTKMPGVHVFHASLDRPFRPIDRLARMPRPSTWVGTCSSKWSKTPWPPCERSMRRGIQPQKRRSTGSGFERVHFCSPVQVLEGIGRIERSLPDHPWDWYKCLYMGHFHGTNVRNHSNPIRLVGVNVLPFEPTTPGLSMGPASS